MSNTPSNDDSIFVWTDVETTGLNPKEECLLEVGFIVTNSSLITLGGAATTVEPLWADPRERVSDYVREMHDRSGLWEALALGDNKRLRDAEEYLIEDLTGTAERFGFDLSKQPLCGSSVGFDRKFLAEHMPRLEALFHYRNIDISTVKELARRLNPEIAANTPAKLERHRVIPDLQDTLNEAGWYFDRFLNYDKELFSA